MSAVADTDRVQAGRRAEAAVLARYGAEVAGERLLAHPEIVALCHADEPLGGPDVVAPPPS